MRVSDGRYDRDRRRLELAHRLLGYGVRTELIRHLTTLSAERVRRLYRAYYRDAHPFAAGRPRGKPPRRMAYFRRSAVHELEAAMLGTLLLNGELADRFGVFDCLTLDEAETFCETYDLFVEFCPGTDITFEHAWFLAHTLERRDEYALVPCTQCRTNWIQDLLALEPSVCASCRWSLVALELPELGLPWMSAVGPALVSGTLGHAMQE